jgi:hypothetical protein
VSIIPRCVSKEGGRDRAKVQGIDAKSQERNKRGIGGRDVYVYKVGEN